MKNVSKIISELWHNIVRTMKLAYEIDGRLVTMYYLTAGIGAVSPIIAAYLFKLVLDNLVITSQAMPSQVGIPMIIIFVLAGYFLMRLVETIVYWGLNVSYYDYLLRNKFQNGLNYRYTKKLSSLDLGHLENPEIQNLITKVEHTFTWQIPDFIRMWNYIFSHLIGIIAAIIALMPFGLWIPVVVLLVASPRVYLKARHGNFVWSMYGAGAPEVKRLWYTRGLLTTPSSIIETRIFQSQEALLERLEEFQKYLYERNKKPLDNYRWVLFFAPLVEATVVFAIVYFMLPNALSGALTIGSLTFVITALEQMRSNTSWGASHLGELYQNSLFVSQFFELMALPKLIREKKMPIHSMILSRQKSNSKMFHLTIPTAAKY